MAQTRHQSKQTHITQKAASIILIKGLGTQPSLQGSLRWAIKIWGKFISSAGTRREKASFCGMTLL